MNKRLCTVLLTGIILIGLSFYFYYGIYKMIYIHFHLVGPDFERGYYAAQNFVQGHLIYTMPNGINPYYYLPLTVLIFLPFCKFPLHQAIIIWFILTHIFILFSICIIYKYGYRKNRMNSAVAAITALFFSMPLYQTVISGNINILIFAGICLVYGSVISGKRNLIPLILAGCTYLKIYPALLMAAFIRNRDYRACKSFFLLAALLGILSIGIFGLASHYILIQRLPSLSKFIGLYHCMSFTFFMKLFLPECYENMILIGNFMFFLLLLILWWKKSQTYSDPKSDNTSIIIDLFVLTVITVLVTPSSWIMYHALFIVPFYFIIFTLLENRNQLKYIGVFIVLFCLINFWEIIFYQLPLSFDHLTIREIGQNKSAFPVLYPLLYSLHFILNVIFFSWLLLNYNELRQALQIFVKESTNK